MKKLPLTVLTTFVAAIALVLAAMPASAQYGDCLSNRDLQAAVTSGEIAPVASVLADAGIGGDEQVLSVKVCDEGGSLVYVVAVVGPDGDARNLVLPAAY